MGSDKEVSSDFQLIAGTHRDLRVDVAEGRFREDLFARINLWSYTLPGLAQRPEDLEPNIDHLLLRAAGETGSAVRFNAEARAVYLQFAKSAAAPGVAISATSRPVSRVWPRWPTAAASP